MPAHVATVTNTANAATCTVSTTVAAGSDRLLIASHHMRGATTSLGVTFNTIPCTEVGTGALGGLGNNNGRRVHSYYYIAPDVGTYDVVATLSGSGLQVVSAGTFTGAHQTTPVGTPDTDEQVAAASLQVDPASTTSDLAYAAITFGSTGAGAGVADGSMTPTYTDVSSISAVGSGAVKAGTTTSTAMIYTFASPAAGIGQALIGFAIKPAASAPEYTIVGETEFTLTPASGMAVGHAITGDVTHTLNPAATMAVERDVLGDVTFTLTPEATMSQADANEITGDVAFDLVPAAAMAVDRALTGEVTHTLDVASGMAFSEGNAIVGDVAFDLVPAAAMAAGRALTGDVTHTLNVAADLVFTPAAYELAGEVAFTLTPAATMTFSDAEAIVGDVAFTLTPAAQMSAALVHSIAGDVPFVFMTAGGMVFTAPVEISSPLLEQIAADLDGFFDLNGFAVPCRFAGVDFAGIFDAEALDAPGGTIEPASLLAKSTDVAEVARGDTVRVAGADYVVTGRLPDGVGLTRLVFSL